MRWLATLAALDEGSSLHSHMIGGACLAVALEFEGAE